MNHSTLFILLIIIIFSRYLILSFCIDKLTSFLSLKKIYQLKRRSKQTQKEILNSFTAAITFSVGMLVLYHLWENGTLVIYQENTKPWWYHIISVFLALFLHETYYYWLHRFMHNPKVYKYVHKGHHDSVIVSSWTAFSFDWIENILQVLAFFLIAFLIPLHIYSIVFLLVFMSISATINHLNIEIYPRFFSHTFPFKYLIGATHHAIHHKEFRNNYGLYFTFWDRWMNTESKTYKAYIKKQENINE